MFGELSGFFWSTVSSSYARFRTGSLQDALKMSYYTRKLAHESAENNSSIVNHSNICYRVLPTSCAIGKTRAR
eukprot:6025404-Pleurochrysis_carterae.AAC.1